MLVLGPVLQSLRVGRTGLRNASRSYPVPVQPLSCSEGGRLR